MTREFHFKGVITALVTPFFNGQVDRLSFEKLLKDQLDHGIQGFVINGTTGESPTLSAKEVEELFTIARGFTARQVPLIVGTGTNNTATTIENTQRAERWGADAVLVVTPYYNKPPQRGLFHHFKTVAEKTSLPVILYNVPGRTITSIEPETVAELSKIKNIVGIKEASGQMSVGQKMMSLCGSNFLVTSGDDLTCLDLALRGGKGVISVISHLIPGPMVDLMERAMRGEEGSLEQFKKYEKLTQLTYCESNPIPVKMGVYLRQLIRSPELRSPLAELLPENTKALREEMERLGIL